MTYPETSETGVRFSVAGNLGEIRQLVNGRFRAYTWTERYPGLCAGTYATILDALAAINKYSKP